MNDIELFVCDNKSISTIARVVKCHFPTMAVSHVINSVRSKQPLIVADADEESMQALDGLISVCEKLFELHERFRLFVVRQSAARLGDDLPQIVRQEIGMATLLAIREVENTERLRILSDRVLQFLNALSEVTWFDKLGGDDCLLNACYPVFVKSGEEVVRREDHWAAVLLEVQNLLTETLCYQFPTKFHRSWNRLSAESGKLCCELVERKVADCRDCLTPRTINLVSMSLLRIACLEVQFADCIAPRFAKRWASVLADGRLPCDWIGDLDSSGKLVVY